MATRIREKAAAIAKNKDNRPMAKVKYVRISPSKIRIVLDNIRGKSAVEALALMENAKQANAEVVVKLLKSAIANAENNKGLNRNDLYVAETWVGAGPILKRINIRARGRADRMMKRTCHITLILDVVK
ncbi:MAG: 50S ribosomal protein L22 [Clostridia bacterium]|nr:50S ribosomal protein L22 [Clostridia bacterium]MBR2053052.1 50S ribosomal protein L22 [Clostridia bacterium]MBR2220864.1 50S ribosomal protein L22 [Clostridia bacterium]MBR2433493.1 50S ribosomal protein L22 [Clostridia bacterium]MBR3790314.1 50S ribosomal protein L22 [Clostridia bacterium]